MATTDTVTTTLTSTLKVQHKQTSDSLVSTLNATFDFGDDLTDGTAINQCDLFYGKKAVAISGSATNSLDLAGSLADSFGATLTFVKLKFFYFKNLSVTAGDTLTLGGDANALLLMDAAADTITIGPNGVFFRWEPSAAGIGVTAGTGDILDILENAGNANTYDICFGGTSA